MKKHLNASALSALFLLAALNGFAANVCELQQGMSLTKVSALLGTPDWVQPGLPAGQACWAYWNAGTEYLFKNGGLYAVRYTAAAPLLPSRLSAANLIPGRTGRPVRGLGSPIDRSEGRWRTEIYSDKNTYAVAANYSLATSTLNNVLLQQGTFTATCDKASTASSRELFRAWYVLGSTITDVLVAHAKRDPAALLTARNVLQDGLRMHGVEETPPESSLHCCAEAPHVAAVTLREFLVVKAAEVGRRHGNSAPTLGLWTGLFLSLAEFGPTLGAKAGAGAEWGLSELMNHFGGIPPAVYPLPAEQASKDQEALLQALRSSNPQALQKAARQFASHLLATH